MAPWRKIIVFAKSEDGIIEGYHHESLPIIGIMWHPEREETVTEFDRKLISLYINKKFFWK